MNRIRPSAFTGSSPVRRLRRTLGLALSILFGAATSLLSQIPGVSGPVHAMVTLGERTFVAGGFSQAGDIPAVGIAEFDGKEWRSLSDSSGRGIEGSVHALAVIGDTLVVGGQFSGAGALDTRNLAFWNLRERRWEPVGHGFGVDGPYGSVVNTLTVVGSDLYVGGQFVTADTIVAVNIARWDGRKFRRVGAGLDNEVRVMTTDNRHLYVSGAFQLAGDEQVNGFARYDLTEKKWEPVPGPTLNSAGAIRSMLVHEGSLYVGGSFNSIGGVNARAIARFDLDTEEWDRLGNGLLGRVDAILPHDGGLLIGGGIVGILGVSTSSVDGPRAMVWWDGSRYHQFPEPRSGAIDTFYRSGVVKVSNLDSSGVLFWRDDRSGYVTTMNSRGDGTIVIGGNFDLAGPMKIIADDRLEVEPGRVDLHPSLGSVAMNVVLWRPLDNRWRPPGHSFDDPPPPPPATTPQDPNPEIAADVPEGGPRVVDASVSSSPGGPCTPLYDDGNWALRFAPGADDEAFALAVDEERVYVGGSFETMVEVVVNGIAVWNGSTWSPLGSGNSVGVDGFVFAIAVKGDSVLVGGQFSSAGGIPAENLAIFNRRTGQWESFGGGVRSGEEAAYVSAILPTSGGIVVAGSFDQAGTGGGVTEVRNVAVLADDSWNDLDGGIDGVGTALAEWGPGFALGGSFTTAGNQSALNVAAWTGTDWQPVGEGLQGDVNALRNWAGNLIAGGDFEIRIDDSTTARNIAQFQAGEWRVFGGDVTGPVRAIAPEGSINIGGDFLNILPVGDNPVLAGFYNVGQVSAFGFSKLGSGLQGPVNAIANGRDGIYVAGAFVETTEGVLAPFVARFRGGGWEPAAWLPKGPVSALTLVDDTLFAGGSFYSVAAGGEPAVSGVARRVESSWVPVPIEISGAVYTLETADRQVYLGGQFLKTGNTIAVNVSALDPSVDLYRPVTPGSGVAGGEQPFVAVMKLQGNRILVGGRFHIADTFLVGNLAAWDRITGEWSEFGAGVNGTVWSLLPIDDREFYLGGDFVASGADSLFGVARWDGQRFHQVGSRLRGPVHDLEMYDGRLYAAGRFHRFGSTDTLSIVRLSADGSSWEVPGDGLNHVHLATVNALEVVDGKLFAGGLFSYSSPWDWRNFVAKWDGSSWSRLGSGTNAQVWAMAAQGDSLYVGGVFDSAGCKASLYVAMWHEQPTHVELPKDGLDGLLTLLPVTPTPSRGHASAAFRLSIPMRVEARLFDARGREVALLHEGWMAAGTHGFELEMEELPTGRYLLRLQTDAGSASTSILLLR